jgi:hypothetical protein
MEDTIFPSKVLLFGEYSVIRGSKALAMPFGRFFRTVDPGGEALRGGKSLS